MASCIAPNQSRRTLLESPACRSRLTDGVVYRPQPGRQNTARIISAPQPLRGDKTLAANNNGAPESAVAKQVQNAESRVKKAASISARAKSP
jgi:hypothetical protein